MCTYRLLQTAVLHRAPAVGLFPFRPLDIRLMPLQASKLLNKLGTRLAARMKDEGRAGSITMDVEGSRAVSAAMGASGSASSVGSDAAAGAAPKAFGSIKKLVAALDGSIWLGYKRGLLEKYSEGGQLLWSNASSLSSSSSAAGAAAGAAAFRPAGITALAAVGSSVWVGDNQGQVWVLDAASAALQRTWKAHIFPVRSIAAGGHLVYSLGKAGSIRAWQAQPVPAALTAAWQQDLSQCLQEQQLQVGAAHSEIPCRKCFSAPCFGWLCTAAPYRMCLIAAAGT